MCITKPNLVPIGRTVAESWPFFSFLDGGVRHLGCLKVENFDCWICLQGQYASTCQIVCWLCEPLRRYDRFPIFQKGGRLPSGVLKGCNFYWLSGSEDQYASPSQISYWSVEPLRRYGRFSIFQDGAVRHLQFLKVRNFTYRSDREDQYAYPSLISCRSVELLQIYDRFSIFQDGGHSPSWTCFTCIWTTHEEHLLVFVTAKFGWNRCSSFDNMPVLMFCVLQVWLENAYSRPFLGGFWGIWPLRWDTILTNLTKVPSMVHSGSSGILFILVSIVVPEKLPGQKRCEEEDELCRLKLSASKMELI